MNLNNLMKSEGVWIDKHLYDEAEKSYYENLAKDIKSNSMSKKVSIAGEVAKAREKIKKSLDNINEIPLYDSSAGGNIEAQNKIISLENALSSLRQDFEQLKISYLSLQKHVNDLDKKFCGVLFTVNQQTAKLSENLKPIKSQSTARKDENDDVDLFGSGSENEDEEIKRMKEKRLADYEAKKAKKPTLIAKSNIILDVKPWDDETNLKEMENKVRNIEMDGLVWGASKLVPLAYGIEKLQISCVVEDDKVSVDELQEKIQDDISDYVQSVDIAAFNKV